MPDRLRSRTRPHSEHRRAPAEPDLHGEVEPIASPPADRAGDAPSGAGPWCGASSAAWSWTRSAPAVAWTGCGARSTQSPRGPRQRGAYRVRYDCLRRWVRPRNLILRIACKSIESSQRLSRPRWTVERTVAWPSGWPPSPPPLRARGRILPGLRRRRVATLIRCRRSGWRDVVRLRGKPGSTPSSRRYELRLKPRSSAMATARRLVSKGARRASVDHSGGKNDRPCLLLSAETSSRHPVHRSPS